MNLFNPSIPTIIPGSTNWFYFVTLSASIFCQGPNSLHQIRLLIHSDIGKQFMIRYYKRIEGDLSSNVSLDILWDGHLNAIWTFRKTAPWFVAIASSSVVSKMVESLGRKNALFLINSLVNIVGDTLCLLAVPLWTFEFCIVGELLHGFTVGTGIGLSMLYLTETVPTHLRGKSAALFSCVATSFYLLTMIAGPFSSIYTWYSYYSLSFLLSTIAMAVSFKMPETTKFLLLACDRRAEAHLVINRFYPVGTPSHVITEELNGYRRELPQGPPMKKRKTLTFSRILKWNHLRRGLFVGITGTILREVCSATFYLGHEYASRAFHLSKQNSRYVSIASVAVSWTCSIFTVFYIERVSRRKLFAISTAAMIILEYFVQICLAHYFYFEQEFNINAGAIFHFGVGPLYALSLMHAEILLILEVVPQVARSKTLGAVLFVDNLTKMFYYVIVDHFIKQFSPQGMIIYAGIAIPNMLMWMWLYLAIPETTGRHVSDIVEPWVTYDNKVDWKNHFQMVLEI